MDVAGSGAEAPAVGRTDMDAPEVDLVCKIAGYEAQAGDVVRVRVEAVDEDFDLVATLVEEAPAS